MKEDKNINKRINNLKSFYFKNRRMPSYREAGELFGLKSKSSVSFFLNKLKEKKLIEKDSSGKIIPTRIWLEKIITIPVSSSVSSKNINPFLIPVIGTVEAGFPTDAEENRDEGMSLDDYLIENKNATYLLKVKGDSMKDAGILDGDLAVIERTSNAKDGDIVIAEIDGKWTMKYLRNRNSQIYLEPANQNYSKIFPKNELKIMAVVKGVVRKF